MAGLGLPRVIGHRGAAASAPENTLAGLRRAAALGAAWVEIDVRLTADAVPVVMHDDRLARTTDGNGFVRDTTLTELKELDAGGWFGPAFAGEKVPTLAEAVAMAVDLGLGLNIELKAEAGCEAETGEGAARVARAVWPAGRAAPLLSSFSGVCLAAAAEVVPEWPRELLLRRLPGDWRRRAAALGCAAIGCAEAELAAAQVAELHAAGLAVLAYTVNDPGRARLLWGWGVDALFSDTPERLLAA